MPDSGLNKKPTRFLHLSDLHFGAEDREALRQVQDFAARIKPDAVIVSGDITQTGARDEFAAARTWFDQLGIRVIAAPGNHDTPVVNLAARMIRPFGRYQRYMSSFDLVDRLAEFQDGAIRISAINTARGWQSRLNWADGVVDMDDLDAALSLLAGGPRDAWRLLICHHPLVHPAHSRIPVDTLRGEVALKRCIAAGVDAVLTGHIHDAFACPVESTARPIVQMGSGTLSTRLRANRAGFCVLEFDGDRMVQEVVTIDRAGLEISRRYDSAANPAGTETPDHR
jgi:3',5'-cyclic AMP phosphodiesterase CpdA